MATDTMAIDTIPIITFLLKVKLLMAGRFMIEIVSVYNIIFFIKY